MVSIVGTPLYMSPQLLDKQKYTAKADIWSLGIILHEMLFGTVPWAGKDPETYSKNIKSHPLVIDRKINNISSEIEDLLRQCLQVNEEDRISWTELFNHSLMANDDESDRSTRENSKDWDMAECHSPERHIRTYNRDPVNPSSLMNLCQTKILAASKNILNSQMDVTRTTISQKLRQIDQVVLSLSMEKKIL